MKEIGVRELKEALDKGEDIQLIDVREPWEHKQGNIGGENIPVGIVPDEFGKISKNKKVIIYCRSGVRSANCIKFLESDHGFQENLYNLVGGILDWSDKIDPSIPKY